MQCESRYARWEDAMISQARLHQFSCSSMGQRYMLRLFKHENEGHHPQFQRSPELLSAIQVSALERAEPTYVTASSCDLIDYARQSFEPEVPRPSDPWTPHGFALFERPLMINDAPQGPQDPLRSPSGKIPVRAMGWTSIGQEDPQIGSFWISFYIDVDDELETSDLDDRYADVNLVNHMRRFMPLSLGHVFQWQWGQGIRDDYMEVKPSRGETVEDIRRRGIQQVTLVQTVWRLGSQYVPVPERPPRAVRRDSARKGIKHSEHVNVIVLRRGRVEATEGEPTGRHLAVQHPVRGYWGRRHRKEGTRQVWVDSYIRGGDDLPFKASSLRAYEFKR
jgi:hypothetical protein